MTTPTVIPDHSPDIPAHANGDSHARVPQAISPSPIAAVTFTHAGGTVLAALRQIRADQIAAWLQHEWALRYPGVESITVWSGETLVNADVLSRLDQKTDFAGYRFVDCEYIESPVVYRTVRVTHENVVKERSGAFRFRFQTPDDAPGTKLTAEVLVVSTHVDEEGNYLTTLASCPAAFRAQWVAFANECNRLAYAYEDRVVVVGGRQESFEPTVEWSDIILPEALKTDLLDDVRSFFTKGVGIYRRLNLKPFRKLLLAGVPGTGKTMICNALAKWALKEGYQVIYVSSAQKGKNDQYGSTFSKIQYALDVASRAETPALIILEELDAYLHDEEKALILNVLDGSESIINDKGTLLITTTNYPEVIDERVLKRPGRLDRVFIIPETKNAQDAGEMLKHYLGALWQEEHRALVPQLIGYPGAFIREVAIYALTEIAYADGAELPLSILEQSFVKLKEQIEARDDFLHKRNLGFEAQKDGGTAALFGGKS